MADQVPADRQVGQGRGLFPQLLRPALAQFAAAGRHQRATLGRDVLGHGHQRDRRRPAARAAASAIRPRTRATFSAMRADRLGMVAVRNS